jgi:hypothetical protein
MEMKEVTKIEKIQITYDKETAERLVTSLELLIDRMKEYDEDFEPWEDLCDLIEDLTWNVVEK